LRGGYKFMRAFVKITLMRRVIWFIVAVLLSASCAVSGGGKKDAARWRNDFADLPADAPVYVSVDTVRSRTLLDNILVEHGLNGKTVKAFFDKTERAAAALYPRIDGRASPDRAFLLACYGHAYPAFLSSLSFFFSRSWKQVRSVTGKKYWHSSKNRISLYMRRDRAYISDADPFFAEESTAPPDNFACFSDGARVSVWLRDASLLNNALARIDIPVMVPATAIFIAAFEIEGYWQAAFRVETPSETQARGLVILLSMVSSALSSGRITAVPGGELARLLLSETPSLEGSALTLKSPRMTQAEIARLIALLSIYLK
jgi:hypothetical protein